MAGVGWARPACASIALAPGPGVMLTLYAYYYAITDLRPGQGFLWLAQSIGFGLAMGLLLSPFKEVNVAIGMVSYRNDRSVVMVASVRGFSGPIPRCVSSMIRVLR